MCLIATEDELSEAVVLKMLSERKISRHAVHSLPKSGFGYLKKNVSKFCNAAQNGRNVFVLTDLDNARCAPSLLTDWFSLHERPERLLFRVAVREVEAWVMADKRSFSEFLGISPAIIGNEVDSIVDPKSYLLRISERAKASIKRELLPRKGVLARQGFGYNEVLGSFVRNHWSSTRAAEHSQSLKKALIRLDAWSEGIPNSAKVT
jgi:hypothetical protein